MNGEHELASFSTSVNNIQAKIDCCFSLNVPLVDALFNVLFYPYNFEESSI